MATTLGTLAPSPASGRHCEGQGPSSLRLPACLPQSWIFISSLGLTGDIRLTFLLHSGGPGEPGLEAGRPRGLELLLASAPHPPRSSSCSTRHHAQRQGGGCTKGTPPSCARPPWAHTHQAEATLEGLGPGGRSAENSHHTGLSVACLTGWRPWEPSPPRPSSSTPAIPKVPCPSLMGRVAQSTREQASGITPLVLG